MRVSIRNGVVAGLCLSCVATAITLFSEALIPRYFIGDVLIGLALGFIVWAISEQA